MTTPVSRALSARNVGPQFAYVCFNRAAAAPLDRLNVTLTCGRRPCDEPHQLIARALMIFSR
jgi:hypothetical protein